jgi:hypothetical protein
VLSGFLGADEGRKLLFLFVFPVRYLGLAINKLPILGGEFI